MLSSLTLATAAAHYGPGFGFGWLFFVVPLFWIGLVILFVTLSRRRWSRNGAPGPWGHGAWSTGRAAEGTLAERFAQGDIDEKEYRARLEVLRANNGYGDDPRK